MINISIVVVAIALFLVCLAVGHLLRGASRKPVARPIPKVTIWPSHQDYF